MVAAAATTAAALPTLTCGRRIRGVARGAPPPSENTSLPPPSRARRRGLHPLHSPALPLPQGKAKRAAEKAAEAEREGRHRERIAEAELKVHAEIEAKREKRRKEEKALSEELKAIKIKNQFLGADKEAVERKKWASQQAGAQREIEKIQREKQEAAVAKAQIARKEEAQRLLNLRREREEHERYLADYERRCKEAQFDAAAAADAVALSREQATHDERLRLGAATLTMQDNYEYRTAISHNEQAKAARSSARRDAAAAAPADTGFGATSRFGATGASAASAKSLGATGASAVRSH